MAELKPCPFCGGEVAEVDEEDGIFFVVCNYLNGGCGASSCHRTDEAEAIEAWNRRVDNG